MADARHPDVCVIIAAWNAAATVGAAVASALAEPEVAEVIVVDDASTDNCLDAAIAADDGSGRLVAVRQPARAGPSAARNRGIALSNAPRLAILDSDDLILPGRFAALATAPEADLVADNILFVDPERGDWPPKPPPHKSCSFTDLSLAEFVLGNIARPNRPRGELGYLKPVMSRAFLDRHGLRYDEGIWLGEDYDLYVRMLLRDARFLLSRRLGYAALSRPTSLSRCHSAADLLKLSQASRRHVEAAAPSHPALGALRQHARQTRDKFLHRDFLDRKAEAGLWTATARTLWPPRQLWTIGARIARDKLRAARPRTGPAQYTLLPTEP